MSDNYGDTIITITDEDGVEYVLEVLAVIELDGTDYYALIPAETSDDEEEPEVNILKAVEEDGEEILCAIEDEDELERVYQAMTELLFSDDEEE